MGDYVTMENNVEQSTPLFYFIELIAIEDNKVNAKYLTKDMEISNCLGGNCRLFKENAAYLASKACFAFKHRPEETINKLDLDFKNGFTINLMSKATADDEGNNRFITYFSADVRKEPDGELRYEELSNRPLDNHVNIPY